MSHRLLYINRTDLDTLTTMSKVSSQYGKGVEICVSWQKASDSAIPPKAVKAAHNVFVARAMHEGQMIPGKLVEGYKGVFVAYGNKEHNKLEYEVLVHSSVFGHEGGTVWKQVDGHEIPSGAIVGGTCEGQALYIARSEINGNCVVGKFYPPHGAAYFPYGGIEHKKTGVEVLCCSSHKM